MTKTEIEQAAKEYSTNERKDEFRNDSFYDGMYSGRIFGFIAGASMVNEKQPYSAKDMMLWIVWYITFGIQHIKRNPKITDYELLKLWEDSK